MTRELAAGEITLHGDCLGRKYSSDSNKFKDPPQLDESQSLSTK